MLIRKLLLFFLSFTTYLRAISFIFLKTWRMGLHLKAHQQIDFLRTLVRPGDQCIDIGANLGYFSIPLSHYVGVDGKVWSVEPVPMFREVLEANSKRFGLGNITILPYALGESDHETVQLFTPSVDGVVRHGRTAIGKVENGTPTLTHEAQMRNPSTLFASLERLDFVKCDVEGYELFIIPHFLPILGRFKPIIEIEASPQENKDALIMLLEPFGYAPYILMGNTLVLFDRSNPVHKAEIELYFKSERS